MNFPALFLVIFAAVLALVGGMYPAPRAINKAPTDHASCRGGGGGPPPPPPPSSTTASPSNSTSR